MMMMMMAVMAMMVLAWVMIVIACHCSGSDKGACHLEGKVGKFRGGKDKGAGTHGKVHDEKKVVNFTLLTSRCRCCL